VEFHSKINLEISESSLFYYKESFTQIIKFASVRVNVFVTTYTKTHTYASFPGLLGLDTVFYSGRLVPKGPEEIIAFFFRTGSEVGGSVFL
jgi:hypothetical protein